MSQPDRPVLVRGRAIVKTYGAQGVLRRQEATRAIDGADIDIYVGEVVALIGESGSGKTTLGKVLLRLTSLDAGTVVFDGVDVFGVPARKLRELRRQFQMVFQNQSANLHPKMTVQQMMDESLRLHRPELDAPGRLSQARDLLDRVGLAARAGQRPASLSGGERRRVGLARILATKPRLIVADEPTSGLDAAIKQQMIDLLKDLKDPDLAYLLISHDLGRVRRISQRVLVMLKGRIIEEVTAGELGHAAFHHPYTHKLMRAADLLEEGRESHPAGGADAAPAPAMRPFDPAAPPTTGLAGCVHAADCQLAARLGILSRCTRERPAPVRLSETHWVACHAAEAPKEARG